MPRIVEEVPGRSIYQESFDFIKKMRPGQTAEFVQDEDFHTTVRIFNSSIRHYITINKIPALTYVRGDSLFVERN